MLPRLLRRPARLIARLCDGEYAPPRYAGVIATAVFLSSSALYGAWLGGQIPGRRAGGHRAPRLRRRSGPRLRQQETSEIDILERLDLDGWTSLIGFDADAARQRIAELPWVKVAAVRKVYPDALEVRIEEREPFAIWQHGSQLAIVERSGNVIAPFGGGRHAVLPLVIGYGAAEQAAGFVDKIRQHPELAARVKGFIRVAERRWDLRLENGITISLPETGEDAAIAEVLRLDREDGLLSRDIAAVDLRLDDRLVVRLTPEAMERRTTRSPSRRRPPRRSRGRSI